MCCTLPTEVFLLGNRKSSIEKLEKPLLKFYGGMKFGSVILNTGTIGVIFRCIARVTQMI